MQNTFGALLQRIDALLAGRSHVTVAIDGRCGAGKSTLAGYLGDRYPARVTHTDDFFLPPELRTPERLAEPGGNLHYERFRAEVMDRLAGDIAYRRFDCRTGELLPPVTLPYTGLDVIEGAYCLHPYFGEYADIRVFLSLNYEERLRRIAGRCGEGRLQRFVREWIPLEEAYFAACRVERRCEFRYNMDLYETPRS